MNPLSEDELKPPTVRLLSGSKVECYLADVSTVAGMRSRVAQSLSVAPVQVKLLQGNIELADGMPLPMGQTLQATLNNVQPELAWYPAGRYPFNGKDVLTICYSGSRETWWRVCFTDGTDITLDEDESPAEASKISELIREWAFVKYDLHYSTKDVSYYDEREYTPREDPAEWESYINGHHRGARRKSGGDWWEAIRARKTKSLSFQHSESQ